MYVISFQLLDIHLPFLDIQPNINTKYCGHKLQAITQDLIQYGLLCSFDVFSDCFLAIEYSQHNYCDIVMCHRDFRQIASADLLHVFRCVGKLNPIIELVNETSERTIEQAKIDGFFALLKIPFTEAALKRNILDCVHAENFMTPEDLYLTTQAFSKAMALHKPVHVSYQEDGSTFVNVGRETASEFEYLDIGALMQPHLTTMLDHSGHESQAILSRGSDVVEMSYLDQIVDNSSASQPSASYAGQTVHEEEEGGQPKIASHSPSTITIMKGTRKGKLRIPKASKSTMDSTETEAKSSRTNGGKKRGSRDETSQSTENLRRKLSTSGEAPIIRGDPMRHSSSSYNDTVVAKSQPQNMVADDWENMMEALLES